MASQEQHALHCEKRLCAYLADKQCDICSGSEDLALVYRKRWWADIYLNVWAQTKSNLTRTLSLARVTCRPCITARIERIRVVLESGRRFDECQEEGGCPAPVAARGYCVTHRHAYMQLTGTEPRRMAPRGSGRINEQGYRSLYLPGHPNANQYGRIAEHRKVMADKLGRPLRPEESPHHKNGIRSDNRPENLELWVKPQPPGQRVSDLVTWAREIIGMYGDEVERGLVS